jgi:hypothetical protein
VSDGAHRKRDQGVTQRTSRAASRAEPDTCRVEQSQAPTRCLHQRDDIAVTQEHTVNIRSIATAAPHARPATRSTTLRPIRNALVRGNELLDAVCFLADALALPALKPAPAAPDGSITARCAVILPFRAQR